MIEYDPPTRGQWPEKLNLIIISTFGANLLPRTCWIFGDNWNNIVTVRQRAQSPSSAKERKKSRWESRRSGAHLTLGRYYADHMSRILCWRSDVLMRNWTLPFCLIKIAGARNIANGLQADDSSITLPSWTGGTAALPPLFRRSSISIAQRI